MTHGLNRIKLVYKELLLKMKKCVAQLSFKYIVDNFTYLKRGKFNFEEDFRNSIPNSKNLPYTNHVSRPDHGHTAGRGLSRLYGKVPPSHYSLAQHFETINCNHTARFASS